MLLRVGTRERVQRASILPFSAAFLDTHTKTTASKNIIWISPPQSTTSRSISPPPPLLARWYSWSRAMADVSFIVGILGDLDSVSGNVISILVFASPIGTFPRIVKTKSTESFKGLPYITTLLSTSLWTFYGLLKPGGLLVVTVNGVGTVLQAIYIILFLIYAPSNTRAKMAKLVGMLNVGFFGAVVVVTLVSVHASRRLLVVGFLCAALTVGMYASPMAAMHGGEDKERGVHALLPLLLPVPQRRAGFATISSSAVLDFPSISTGLRSRVTLQVPNAIGFALGSAQLLLYAVYRRKKPAAKASELEAVEEGSAHLVGHVEMQGFEDSNKASQHKHLNKGSSLPKPSAVPRQQSFQKIVKAVSTTPYELHFICGQNDHTVN
ncbi:hypothetical protein BHM03_00022107 [Ensete ventricosum]|nr:hypothetical protein BHM03_00022107 [Ensete ventricosum]